MTMSLLDHGQVIKSVYDSANSALQVSIVAGSSAAPVPIIDGQGSGNLATVNSSKELLVSSDVRLILGAAPSATNALAIRITNGTAYVDPTQIRALTSADVVSAVQSGTWNVTNISGTISLPTGAATSAKQPALGTAGSASADVITVQGIASMTALKVDGSGVTQPVSAASLPLPTGAATAANQTSLAAQLPTTLGTKTSANALAVVLASDQAAIPEKGFTSANAPVYNDYTGTSVTTGAYVQLVSSTTSATQEIEIFDSSGQALYLATGAALSEANQIIIVPGGNGRVKLAIPASTRISVKAITGTANVGFITINFYG